MRKENGHGLLWLKKLNGNKDGVIDPETEIVTRSDKLCIRQYNTITVCYTGWNGDTAECGFSRYDVLDEDGDPVTNEWGFSGFYNNRIYIQRVDDGAYYAVGSRSNGAYNMLHIGATAYEVGDSWDDNWEKCAARVAQEVFKKVDYIFVSSDCKTSKHLGGLYEYACKQKR